MNGAEFSLTWGNAIAIYAAIVSSIVGAIQVVKFFKESRSKIIVKAVVGSQQRMVANEVIRQFVGDWQTMMLIDITNHSVSDKFITSPLMQVKSPNLFGRKKLFSVMDFSSVAVYPKKLSPGEVYSLRFDAITIRDAVKSAKTNKVKIMVTDTYNNNFFSKWVNIDEIKFNN